MQLSHKRDPSKCVTKASIIEQFAAVLPEHVSVASPVTTYILVTRHDNHQRNPSKKVTIYFSADALLINLLQHPCRLLSIGGAFADPYSSASVLLLFA
jgi:hypothetical protein